MCPTLISSATGVVIFSYSSLYFSSFSLICSNKSLVSRGAAAECSINRLTAHHPDHAPAISNQPRHRDARDPPTEPGSLPRYAVETRHAGDGPDSATSPSRDIIKSQQPAIGADSVAPSLRGRPFTNSIHRSHPLPGIPDSFHRDIRPSRRAKAASRAHAKHAGVRRVPGGEIR